MSEFTRLVYIVGMTFFLSAFVAFCLTPQKHAPINNDSATDFDNITSIELLTQYQADRAALNRAWNIPLSEACYEKKMKLEHKYLDWTNYLLRNSPVLSLSEEVDIRLLKNHVLSKIHDLQLEQTKQKELSVLTTPYMPLIKLMEARKRHEKTDSKIVAQTLHKVTGLIKESENLLNNYATQKDPIKNKRLRSLLADLNQKMNEWYTFRDSYDPNFSWWCESPYQDFVQTSQKYLNLFDTEEEIIGDPIGEDALIKQLGYAMIPYPPKDLIKIAEREFEWCEKEKAKTIKKLGAKDWKHALEMAKSGHVEPGEQPSMIKELHDESVSFLKERDLITIPELADDVWRMQMMSPARQKVSPYFTGGEVISVSYPTDTMTHEEKMKSMLGNNRHFSRATVHHELIPGHHLQSYMAKRWNTHRQMFYTPFYVEGWALYWELLLWDLEFQESPLDEVGMLFWRSHRCARIIFSLNFHLGKWSPKECIDFLIERVGHEPLNAEAEVRRSVQGGYSPLYQAAYMLGGLQLRALAKELISSGKHTLKSFHDEVIKQGPIPIAAVRALLTTEPFVNKKSDLPSKMAEWKFND